MFFLSIHFPSFTEHNGCVDVFFQAKELGLQMLGCGWCLWRCCWCSGKWSMQQNFIHRRCDLTGKQQFTMLIVNPTSEIIFQDLLWLSLTLAQFALTSQIVEKIAWRGKLKPYNGQVLWTLKLGDHDHVLPPYHGNSFIKNPLIISAHTLPIANKFFILFNT